MKEIFRKIEVEMKQAVERLHADLKHLRTGRASVAMLDGLTVDYYGNPTPINQVANLSVADATMLIAQPYDSSQIGPIERSIRKSDHGFNPSNDGKVIRIPVPPLTEERRKDLVKKAHEAAEHGRNSVRLARREGNDAIKALEKAKKISQDDEKRGHDEIQKLHDHYIAEIGSALAHKEKDILHV
jgi:ribosome recycling factor